MKCATVFEALLDVGGIYTFVSWSSGETDSLFLEDAWRQSNKSKWRLAFDLQQAGLSRRPPARERVENWAGDLWAPVARRPAGQRGETDGPSGDSLAQDRGCSVPGCACVCLCVCSINRLSHVALGDHLSCGCSSSLSCVVSSTIVAQPDTGAYMPLFSALYAALYQRCICANNGDLVFRIH